MPNGVAGLLTGRLHAGSMPSPQLAMLVGMLRSAPTVPQDMDTAARRQRMEELTATAPTPEGVRVTPVDAGGVPAEWVEPTEASPRGTILYLHGGGYTIGSVRTHRGLVSRLALATGARGLTLDYRLGPEHPFPGAVDDATAAYRWLVRGGTAPETIVIAGDSAGGGLTVAALVALRDAGERLPAAGVCISPWADLACTGESMQTGAARDPMVQRTGLLDMAAAYLAGQDPRAPLASPIYADLRGLPPLLIHVGTAETLLDDATRLADRARAAGVSVDIEVWDDMIHVWHAFAPLLPEADEAVGRIGAWVRERLPA
jgi:monoterpene epsilon-lactone hydrolase